LILANVTPSEHLHHKEFINHNSDSNITQIKPFVLMCGLPEGVIDIDSVDNKTLLYDTTYASSIHRSKRQQETRYQNANNSIIKNGNIGSQTEITPKMRTTLMDWLLEVSDNHKCHVNTYHLAIQIMDHTLSLINVKRGTYQLLGCACLWLAAKLVELHAPQVENLVYAAECCFDTDALISCEQKLIKLFEYKPLMPTRYYFIMRYIKAGQFTLIEENLAIYLIELSLYDITFQKYPMSHVAAAVIHLVLQMMRPITSTKFIQDNDNYNKKHNIVSPYLIWTPTLKYYTEYEEHLLVPTICHLNHMHMNVETSEFKHIQRKYRDASFHSVARIMSQSLKNLRFDSIEAQNIFHQWTLTSPLAAPFFKQPVNVNHTRKMEDFQTMHANASAHVATTNNNNTAPVATKLQKEEHAAAANAASSAQTRPSEPVNAFAKMQQAVQNQAAAAAASITSTATIGTRRSTISTSTRKKSSVDEVPTQTRNSKLPPRSSAANTTASSSSGSITATNGTSAQGQRKLKRTLSAERGIKGTGHGDGDGDGSGIYEDESSSSSSSSSNSSSSSSSITTTRGLSTRPSDESNINMPKKKKQRTSSVGGTLAQNAKTDNINAKSRSRTVIAKL
jgi:hypothetical protein